MLQSISTSHSNNLAPFIRYFEKHQIEWRTTAADCNLPTDVDRYPCWLSSQQCMAFLLAMVKQSKRRVGIEVGKLITLEQLSPDLAAHLDQCQSLGEAIQQLIALMPTFNNHILVWTEYHDHQWFLCHRSAYNANARGFDQAEWFRSYALLSLCRQFLGKHWLPSQVRLSMAEHQASDLPLTAVRTQFRFSQPYGAISIELEEDFSAIPPSAEMSQWSEAITRLVQTYAVLPWFDVPWFAQLLNMSTRTLQRRLAQQQLSLKALRDASRHRVAKQLLSEKLSVAEVAWRCGYNDVSNFNRAFRLWQGITPAQYRRLGA